MTNHMPPLKPSKPSRLRVHFGMILSSVGTWFCLRAIDTVRVISKEQHAVNEAARQVERDKVLETARNNIVRAVTEAQWALAATSAGADLKRRELAHYINEQIRSVAFENLYKIK